MARDLNKIPTIDELRIALEKCGCSIRPYDMVLLNNYLESLTIEDQGNANIVKYLNVSELPTVGDDDTLYVITNNSLLYIWDNGAYLPMSGGGGGGGTIATWGDIIGNILNQQDLAMALNSKVDNEPGKQLSSEDYTLPEKDKLSGIEQGAQVNPSASQIKASYESNANTNAFTDLEKNKLATIEGSHFRGQYTSLSALNSAIPVGEIGDYAFVDLGVGQDVGKYIWDSTDVKWVVQQGQSSAMTPAQIKSGYESNANTNAYTDAEKSKLSGIQAGAQVNVESDWNSSSGDSQILNKPVIPSTTSQLTNNSGFITSETDPTVPSWAKQPTKPAYTKGEVGLANVDNIQQATKSEFMSHDSDSVRHITSAERNAWNASAGAGLSLGETSTTAYRGDRGATAYNHSQSAHAPTNAQKNSDITKSEIEAKLTGTITTHAHSVEEITDFPEKGNLVAGNNISITESGNNITISSTGGGGGGVSIHNDLSGRSTVNAHPLSAITGLQPIADSVTNASTLVAGTNVTLTPSGGNLVISSSGGGGGGSSVHNDLTGRELSNAHPISAITGLQPLTAQIENAPTLVAGSNISLSLSGNNLTISSTGGSGGGGTTVHSELTGREASDSHPIEAITGLETITDQVSNAGNLIAGSNITLTPNGADVTISASGGGGGGSSDWADITNKPATFTPSTHTHSADDVASGTLNIARIPTGTTASTVSLGNHTHTVANITGLQSTLSGLEDSVDNANNLVAGNNITLTPSGNNITISATGGSGSVAWGDVTNKPTSFAPDAHNHSASEVNSGTFAVARLGTGTASASSFLRGDGTWASIPEGGETYTGSTSITLSGNSIQRAALTGDVTSPLNSNVTTLSSTGVTAGTYNNAATSVRPFTVDAKGRITSVGTAVTITPTWGSVSGKPATFAPSSHNHAAGEINSGTLAIARIPTGTTASTVSLGNHSHDEIDNATDLSAIPGYSGTVKQYLTHDALGVLSWENA